MAGVAFDLALVEQRVALVVLLVPALVFPLPFLVFLLVVIFSAGSASKTGGAGMVVFLSLEDIGSRRGGPIGFLAVHAMGEANETSLLPERKSLISNISDGSAELLDLGV